MSNAPSPLRRIARQVYSRLHGSTTRVHGHDNQIELADSVRRHCRIRISGNRNRIEMAPGCRLWDLNLEIVGDDHHLTVGPGCEIRGGHWLLEDRGSRLTIGAGTTTIDSRLLASEGRAIVLGDDCMIGAHVEIRCSDGHSIVNQSDGTRINPAADVTLGSHVWLGSAVRVLKGVTIGKNTVVAAGAVVTRPLPESCVAVGIPARAVRTGTSWDRARLPSP
ncbi:MAG TPA: acyltransferase [Opitutaceae bacterium]|nr:acyltransferase [Opitutaceae bacterium]